eukprot:TRINITY_DN24946_c0_g1_i1.p1 TRINITY_DN24946_c0_g1~~TRINITY_DN24946_c0_g1_i1.p1  ORF type:complete len:246 (-),score=49.64 TRINITY_DN24946_c0_g1_i1:374-1111(-)
MGTACAKPEPPPDPSENISFMLDEKRAREPTQVIGPIQSAITGCCCLRLQSRDTAPEWMLQAAESEAPSLYMRLCTCQWAPVPRVPSGIEKVPGLAGLAGITLQYGDHTTAGSLETLKWGEWDPEKRTLKLTVFGGFYSKWSTGFWTEPTAPLWRSALWCFLMNLARNQNYTYLFEFAEDCCTKQVLEQADDSKDGTHWIRKNASCGGTPEFYYDLYTVWNFDGSPTKEVDRILEKTNQQVMVTF